MAKLRHIAIIVEDPEASAIFFENAFGMKRSANNRRGCHMTDGVMTVALLKKEPPEEVGIAHFGMWVDDIASAEKDVVDAGAVYLGGRPAQSTTSFYEAKFRNPDGLVFDLTHNGWPGAVKDVVPKV